MAAKISQPSAFILPPSLKTRLSQGHPWVYRNQLGEAANSVLPTGSWVQVRCANFTAYGRWDATGPIAIRLFSSKKIPDYNWLRDRVALAWENRAPLRERPAASRTGAYRLIFGEGDGLPGMVVDLYGSYAVIATYSESVEGLKEWLVAALQEVVSPPLKGILQRNRKRSEAADDLGLERGAETPGKLTALIGRLPPRDLIVEEYGLKFRANLFEGQKTGLFLDHRENRRFLEDWAADRRVLNCFSYTGAFSVYAARGGASQVVSCDVAPAATEAAIENFRLNGFDPTQYEFISEDCFELLTRYGKEGRRFDLVILDPPSFAHSKKNVYSALRGYARLNQLALGLVEPGGLLASASCTSYVSPDMFREMLAGAAASVGKRLLLLNEAGQPLDHPVPAHFLEGRYLKFTLGRVQSAS